jgi:hypothetical protein
MDNKQFYKSKRFWLIVILAILVVAALNPGIRKAFMDGVKDGSNSSKIEISTPINV